MNETEAIMPFDSDDVALLHTSEQGKEILEFDKSLIPASHKRLLQRVVPGKGNMIMVMPEDIRIVPGLNPRIQNKRYLDYVQSLKQSMIANGFFLDKPLAGYAGMEGNKPVIFCIEGGTRFAAANLAIAEGAPIEYLPLVLKPEGTSIEDVTIGMVRGNQQLPFLPIELAILCARMRKFHHTPSQIAEEFGIDTSYVHHLLVLAAAPPNIRQMVAEEETTAATAIEAVRQYGEQAEEVLKKALAKSPKKKVTRSMLNGRKQILTKQAPKMFETLELVQKDAAFKQLPDNLQTAITEMIERISSTQNPGETPADAEQASA